ncbi:TetR/AcrR family transcriptional regulator [Curtobacterium aetherium]|uniref:TetR/AcrR family transcriptional regulator n=1 Tax=Curtobacterium aetherium TaxID=2841594 RepID=UPI003B51879C
MSLQRAKPTRRERAKEDKSRRIVAAARALFAAHGVSGVTTQQIADRADVAVGTLFRYAASKAELLIKVQNEKFAAAIKEGLAAADVAPRTVPATEVVLAVLTPVVDCVREQPENGRTYLHELVFGDPNEVNRRDGLILTEQLEGGISQALERFGRIEHGEATVLARVITAIVHISATATIHLDQSAADLLADIRTQIDTVIAPRGSRDPVPATQREALS